MGYIREEPSYNIKETLISRQCNRRSPSSEYVTCGVTPTDLRGLANLCGFLATENYKSTLLWIVADSCSQSSSPRDSWGQVSIGRGKYIFIH